MDLQKRKSNRIIETLADFYQANEAANYDNDRMSSPSGNKEISLQYRNIWRLVNNCEDDGNLLDVGCGTGFFFDCYDRKNIYGVDVSQNMLDIAQNRGTCLKLLKVADAEMLPFPKSCFDIAITNKLIMHHPNYMNILKEMVYVTRKGGSIIADFPNKNSVTYWVTKHRIKSGKIRYYNFFSFKDIKHIASELGLEIKEIKPTTVLSYRFVP